MDKKKMEDIKKQKLLGLKEKAPAFAEDIAPIYKLLSWEWGTEIPDEKKIETHIYGLIDDLIKTGHEFVSCGGIVIKYNPVFLLWQLLFQYEPPFMFNGLI